MHTRICKVICTITYLALMILSGVALFPIQALAAQILGPITTDDAFVSLLNSASDGDTLLITEDISLANQPPLSPQASITIHSDRGATVRGLHLINANVTLSNLTLQDSFSISGTSNIYLKQGVSIYGAPNQAGLSFFGNGTLYADRGCKIVGGYSAPGLVIAQSNGEFYGNIACDVVGGDGTNGGVGMLISPLQNDGALMISGSVSGGNGSSLGGHALNLYDLSANAYVTVDGTLHGGSGAIGGDGIQLVSMSDRAIIGISGHIYGGNGTQYGGSGLIMMNASGSSSVFLSGCFSGGNATEPYAQPGSPLLLVGDSSSAHASIDNCLLNEGCELFTIPTTTPEPEIAESEIGDFEENTDSSEPAPDIDFSHSDDFTFEQSDHFVDILQTEETPPPFEETFPVWDESFDSEQTEP